MNESPASVDSPQVESAADSRELQRCHERYWRKNLILVGILLAAWFFISCVCGIFLAKILDNIHLGGFPLGFWIAQQGSIYVFIALIFIYAWRMDILDKELAKDEAGESDGADNG